MTATVSGARLLGHAATDLADHEQRLGALNFPPEPRALHRAVEQAGLTGRGGAGFPTWRKLAAVAGATGAGAAGAGKGPKPVVIANGAEGEPASAKDRTLLHQAPHLVLDGLQLAADAVGAGELHLYVREDAVEPLQRALGQRRRRDRRRVAIVVAPPTFIAGEESAAIAAVTGRPAVPRDKPGLVVLGAAGGPRTLVQNVETLAHLALVARFGPEWFRQSGTPTEPGTFLATVSGTVAVPGVYEVPFGAPLGEVIAAAGGVTAPLQALLIGGFHGGWVATAPETPLSAAGLRPYGANPGAGVVLALPYGRCGLVETAKVLDYLAGQSAGQCGPCRNGLPALAATFGRLARVERDRQLAAQVERLAALVTGRGACHHPDGTARLVGSALRTFGAEVSAHLEGRCTSR